MLFDAGVQDDKLALIYEVNKNNKVAIKTPFGTTPRVNINQIVLQGKVFSPLQCSVQVDTISKECLEEGKFLYSYKEVNIPPLSMIDDLACISESGTKSVEMNSYINAKTSIKKLQYNVDKSYQIHVGGKEHTTPELFIDKWVVRKKDANKTGINNLTDIYAGKVSMERKNSELYLGDIMSNNGKNTTNILARKNKGHAIINQIMNILEGTCLGPYEIPA